MLGATFFVLGVIMKSIYQVLVVMLAIKGLLICDNGESQTTMMYQTSNGTVGRFAQISKNYIDNDHDFAAIFNNPYAVIVLADENDVLHGHFKNICLNVDKKIQIYYADKVPFFYVNFSAINSMRVSESQRQVLKSSGRIILYYKHDGQEILEDYLLLDYLDMSKLYKLITARMALKPYNAAPSQRATESSVSSSEPAITRHAPIVIDPITAQLLARPR